MFIFYFYSTLFLTFILNKTLNFILKYSSLKTFCIFFFLLLLSSCCSLKTFIMIISLVFNIAS
ncbi:hypothetical protein C1645_768252 [Glomus cerebriforme]|uniref:Uncharacterized protein n=1 Tax=Glomus cerebriforme TaxID=658196 RepID=A0A397T4B7_9GLOM|nr:hypothetical protein C1645_768252 [Glomus cerebriforme]